MRSGGGFIGGGFGLIGMAAGMLTAAALNGLTSRTGIETIVHLQTPQAELYLYHGDMTPDALRVSLTAVSLRLRQQRALAPPPAPASSEHRIDRLHKLMELLDRGLIDEIEFARLKAGLMNEAD